MAQESNEDWQEQVKLLAKAERELEVEQWVVHTIGYRSKEGNVVELYRYELPRRMDERWELLFRWRAAKCQCQYPKEIITIGTGFYYRKNGVNFGFNEAIKSLAAAKAKVSKQERLLREYVEKQSQTLFFDEEEDEQLQKVKAKVEKAKRDIAAAEERMREKYDEYVNQNKKMMRKQQKPEDGVQLALNYENKGGEA